MAKNTKDFTVAKAPVEHWQTHKGYKLNCVTKEPNNQKGKRDILEVNLKIN